MSHKADLFVQYLLNDAFAELEDVTTKHMFGGHAFYLDGRIFAFTGPEDQLLFKANEATSAEYIKRGSKQFVYEGHTSRGPVAMPYWELPQEILEDPQRVAIWARESASLSKKK